MSDSFIISIDNKEYKVSGEKDKIIKASELLNKTLSEFDLNTNISNNLTSIDKTTFAALNIAEMEIANEMNYKQNITNIISEIKNITDYINNFIVE